MVTMTASDVSRHFSTVLDKAEHGETIVITRGGKRVAVLSPAPSGNGADLIDFARNWRAPDDPRLATDIEAVRAVIELDDPWRD
jgi:prevent-host-death family protein